MGKITDYTTDSRINSTDVLVKDGNAGTKIITANQAAKDIAGLVSATEHRSIYRGKYLVSPFFSFTTICKSFVPQSLLYRFISKLLKKQKKHR
jgi:hypothetical protein